MENNYVGQIHTYTDAVLFVCALCGGWIDAYDLRKALQERGWRGDVAETLRNLVAQGRLHKRKIGRGQYKINDAGRARISERMGLYVQSSAS